MDKELLDTGMQYEEHDLQHKLELKYRKLVNILTVELGVLSALILLIIKAH